ncbi:MAG: UPF0239 family protein [Oscillospiraceae bacterium]|nr:UPF0239 family protein [Oscillospiraceae bacterium]
MLKRIAGSILIIIAALVIGGALVGFDIISPNTGAIFWLICIAAAIFVFIRSGSKGQKPNG